MKEIVLVGGGGHCRSCIDLIEEQGQYRIAGIVDRPEKQGTAVMGYAVIGDDNDLPDLVSQYPCFLVTVGQIRSPEPRKSLFQRLRKLGAKLPPIVSPRAHVSRHARLGDGTVVMPFALVGPQAVVGENCIINTRALVEHDVVIGDHCHLATGALVNGGVTVGDVVFIGSGAVVRETVAIGSKTVIGCGVTVRHAIENEGGIWI